MLRPSYNVGIGSENFSQKNGVGLISIRVNRCIGLPTDSCEILLVSNKDYNFSKGDQINIELGYDEELVPVFGGSVDEIENRVSIVKLTALSPTMSLLRLRLNKVYLNQTAGKIVTDLAQEANVNVKEVSDGINLPIYVVDDESNAYEHILRLADRCNFDTYIAEGEELIFKKGDGGHSHTIEFAKNLIGVEKSDLPCLYVSARVYGESPSSIKGPDTSHWLTKQLVKAEAGSGDFLILDDPVVKDDETAKTVAESRLEKLDYNSKVVIETIGNPVIKLGDTIVIESMPFSGIEGDLTVRGIEHYLSKSKGFTTTIHCWMKGNY